MGHDISVKYKHKVIYEIRIPAFDLATSYALYETLGALDYHNGVSGSGETMKLYPSVLVTALINLQRIDSKYSLEEWCKKIKTTRQQTIVDLHAAKIEAFITSKGPKDEQKMGEIGYTLED